MPSRRRTSNESSSSIVALGHPGGVADRGEHDAGVALVVERRLERCGRRGSPGRCPRRSPPPAPAAARCGPAGRSASTGCGRNPGRSGCTFPCTGSSSSFHVERPLEAPEHRRAGRVLAIFGTRRSAAPSPGWGWSPAWRSSRRAGFRGSRRPATVRAAAGTPPSRTGRSCSNIFHQSEPSIGALQSPMTPNQVGPPSALEG